MFMSGKIGFPIASVALSQALNALTRPGGFYLPHPALTHRRSYNRRFRIRSNRSFSKEERRERYLAAMAAQRGEPLAPKYRNSSGDPRFAVKSL